MCAESFGTGENPKLKLKRAWHFDQHRGIGDPLQYAIIVDQLEEDKTSRR
jgi:hypothetical protein